MSKSSSAFVMMICAPLGLAACGGPMEAPDAEGDSMPPPAASIEFDQLVPETHDYVVELPGREERIMFAVDDDDGSVGVLVEAGASGSVLHAALLGDASPAVIYHAVSSDPVPAELLDLHARLHADGQVPSFAEETRAKSPGWLTSLSFSSSSPCSNPTFTTRHCSHPSYNGTYCILNGMGDHERFVANAHRFKAGFCLQEGLAAPFLLRQARDTYYQDGCGIGGTAHLIWPLSQAETRVWATYYLTYVWWRPSGANRRNFLARGRPSWTQNGASVMDFGVRWSRNTSCDY